MRNYIVLIICTMIISGCICFDTSRMEPAPIGKRITVEVKPGRPKPGSEVTITFNTPGDMKGNITAWFRAPYENVSKTFAGATTTNNPVILELPNNEIRFKIKREAATIYAKYSGYDDPDRVGDYAEAEKNITIPVIYVGVIAWVMNNILLFVIAFFALISYRFFTSHRMDFETMLEESGLYELFKDILGKKG